MFTPLIEDLEGGRRPNGDISEQPTILGGGLLREGYLISGTSTHGGTKGPWFTPFFEMASQWIPPPSGNHSFIALIATTEWKASTPTMWASDTPTGRIPEGNWIQGYYIKKAALPSFWGDRSINKLEPLTIKARMPIGPNVDYPNKHYNVPLRASELAILVMPRDA